MSDTTKQDTPAVPTFTKHKDLLMFVSLIEGRTEKEPQEMWVVVTEEEVKSGTARVERANADRHLYDDLRRKLKWAEPGAVFAVTLKDAGISFTPKSYPVMQYEDHVKIAEWRARTTALTRAKAAAADFEKQILRKLDRDGLDPIRVAYHRLTGFAQVQLLAETVRYITSRAP